MAVSAARRHADWLSLLDVSGPFLTLPVLARALPHGLDADDPDHARELRVALEELRDDPALHGRFVRWVLQRTLGLPGEVLLEGQAVPAGLSHPVAEHGETLRPDLVVAEQGGGAPRARMLISVWPAGQALDGRVVDRRWTASPRERMAELCRATRVPLGLVTDGGRWTLVHARAGETVGYATWHADLWLEERDTLRAFRTLLGVERFFAVDEGATLEALLVASAQAQQEVTDALGGQVRHAIELLVDALERADRDTGHRLLAGVANQELYEAAVTVMMRLVFCFFAEERGLLPAGDPLYAEAYAASTLRERLQAEADAGGEELLDRRVGAWPRLLALARALHGGIEHDALRLPAYGGALFDPDRFAFLEGRSAGSTWRETPATPLPVSDRTVLHVLDALQLLRVGGERQRLSYRSLDVEQVGHVYEGLLDHTAERSHEHALGLAGRLEPEIALGELEAHRTRDGDETLCAWLAKETGRGARALARALDVEPDARRAARLRAACGNDDALVARVLPFQALLREDLRGDPTVFLAGSVYVTKALERRASGTYYTPRALAEEVVRHALDPIVHAPGPAEEADPAAWALKPPRELLELRVCDMAMGSGAFLVAACRYLAARLVEAWEALGEGRWTVEGARAAGEPGEVLVPADELDRDVLARRLVCDRCLYGVDKNPMAVDMAKLSLWLVTMARDRPFSFLDHALRCGDSLLGLTSLAQLEHLHMDPAAGERLHGTLFAFTEQIRPAIDRALTLRRELESFPTVDVRDAEHKARLHDEAQDALIVARMLGDVVVGAALGTAGGSADALDDALTSVAPLVRQALAGPDSEVARQELRDRAAHWLAADPGHLDRRPFHWPLELPEALEAGGFDAIVGNPPFQGGQRITGALGNHYRDLLVEHVADGKRGSADLVAYFFLRAAALLRDQGGMALLATNTIGQGDTREVGLDQLLDRGWSIPRAVSSRPWPGGANLEVAHLWLRRDGWAGPVSLDDFDVLGITGSLESRSRVSGPAHRLAANAGHSFQGSIVLGMGFVLSPGEAQRLIGGDPRNAEVVMPYLNGEDLNSRPDQSPARWVINFRDWPIEQAQEYVAPFEVVERLVKPQRAQNNRAIYRDRWWQFAETRPAMRRALGGLTRVLVRALSGKHHTFAFVRSGIVVDQTALAFADETDQHFGVLSSEVHAVWAMDRGATLRRDLRYSLSDCFETFPQPDLPPAVGDAGGALDAHRRALMLDRQEGLTKTYNRVHDPGEQAADIARLRELHVALDHAVRDAYGWTDLDLGHDFHDTRQGTRYTFEPRTRQEILDRLLELNHTRHAAEVRAGLHDRKRPRRRRASKSGQSSLLSE